MRSNANTLYEDLQRAKTLGQKRLAVLLDPDKLSAQQLGEVLELSVQNKIHYLFIGGSLVLNTQLDETIRRIQERCSIPTVLFPGSTRQLSKEADALLLLSLISGRNPEFLIGQQVAAAPFIQQSELEVISCGYMLIDGGKRSAVEYISNTLPIPAQHNDIAACTALAGEMLGLKTIYLEAGSGAHNPVPVELIRKVAGTISVPLIVGGGIRDTKDAEAAWNAGADLLVVGNAIEKKPAFISELMQLIPDQS
jgi:putative glycerol-1-phosphate prenyltransferase